MNSAMPPLYLNSALLGFAGFCVGGALVGERDQQSLVQEREFAQALGQRVEVIFDVGEDARGREQSEPWFRASLGRTGFLHLAGGLALGVGLLPGCAVAPDFQFEFLAQRVYAGDADTVQSAGNFVVEESNLPPACSVVITTWAAEIFSPSISMSSTGMPRPSSVTVMELSR